jgi:hypothetical protein
VRHLSLPGIFKKQSEPCPSLALSGHAGSDELPFFAKSGHSPFVFYGIWRLFGCDADPLLWNVDVKTEASPLRWFYRPNLQSIVGGLRDTRFRGLLVGRPPTATVHEPDCDALAGKVMHDAEHSGFSFA